MEQIAKKAGLTSFHLKWIAIITMLIDHIGAVLYPTELIFRYIGRLAFPIFCLLLVEGFCHTRDIYQYMVRMAIFALLSEIPYDLAFHGQLLEFGSQNVFFTLFLGIVAMYLLQKTVGWPGKAAEVLLVMWLAYFLRTDYSFEGILLIVTFYLLRERMWLKLLGGAAWNLLWLSKIQAYGALAMLPLSLYNGERGKGMKYFFYFFYPAHLLILFAISRYMK